MRGAGRGTGDDMERNIFMGLLKISLTNAGVGG